jgi:hypothetical protein
LHPIKHPECRINAGLDRLSVATNDAKLRFPTPHEEMSVAAGTIVTVVVTHGAPATVAPVVIAIPVSVPSVAAVIPPPGAVIIVIPR